MVRDVPWLKRLFGAPLPVVAIGVLAVCLWSMAFGAYGMSTTQAEVRAQEVTTPSSDAINDTEIHGTRLLRPPLEDAPGLDIAIQDRDGKSMEAFHKALEKAKEGKGQARILFYGASHVAGDIFTGSIRRELQKRYGDAGHGFVVPVHPWRTYRHRDINIESNHKKWKTHRIKVSDSKVERVGLAGVAMESRRAGTFGKVSTTLQGSTGRNASLFELYYYKQPGGGDFEVLIDDKKVKRINTRAPRYKAGYATFRVPDGPHSFEIKVTGRGPVRVFGVAVEREVPGVIVDTLGINGARQRYQLLWEDSLFQEHLKRRNPDLVVLAYGTNEVGDDSPLELYEERLHKSTKRVREALPNASCLFIGPSDRPLKVEEGVFEHRPRTPSVIEIQRRVAMHYGCGFYDLVAFQGGAMSTVEWAAQQPQYASQDHIHYTRRGYERLGDALLLALMEGFEDQPQVADR